MKKQLIFSLACVAAIAFTSCMNRSGNAKTETAATEDTVVMTGNDRDEHGCIGSAGYTWSEMLGECIRIFEKGVRVEKIDGDGASCFIVFNADSTKAQLFFSGGVPTRILDRRNLPGGGFAWNEEDDDTPNVRFVKGIWQIDRRGVPEYTQTTK